LLRNLFFKAIFGQDYLNLGRDRARSTTWPETRAEWGGLARWWRASWHGSGEGQTCQRCCWEYSWRLNRVQQNH